MNDPTWCACEHCELARWRAFEARCSLGGEHEALLRDLHREIVRREPTGHICAMLCQALSAIYSDAFEVAAEEFCDLVEDEEAVIARGIAAPCLKEKTT